MFNIENGHIISLTDKVKATTCKASIYKAIWIKNGKCTYKKPKNFDFIKDQLYIISGNGLDGIVFPKVEKFEHLPPEPNVEYGSVELLDSLFPLIHSFRTKDLTHQIADTIKWCQKYGFPFFGDNGFLCGDIASCYKSTREIGFNFKVFFHDILHLGNIITESLNWYKKEELITEALNISTLQRQQTYVFVNHELMCETRFNTLIALAYYQLGCLLMNPNGAMTKQCEQCGAIFLTTDYRKKYCLKHSPQSYYAQKKRSEKASNTKQ
ncbi:MAG: hypothetical protein KH452_01670 [Clostridiales bacterium]|nr:hypothetical protein [Clostridiales bacterium]